MRDTHLRRWGALYILTVLFLASWAGQFVTQIADFQADQLSHGQPFEWPEFWSDFLRATFENWQSEFLQLAVQALLISAWADRVFRKGTEDQRRLEAKLDSLMDTRSNGMQRNRPRL